MPKHKIAPIPAYIASMTLAECKAAQTLMMQSGEFERAIENRDRWQKTADDWITRQGHLVRRQLQLTDVS